MQTTSMNNDNISSGGILYLQLLLCLAGEAGVDVILHQRALWQGAPLRGAINPRRAA